MSLLRSLFSVPETRKAALEDIDVMFETNPTWLIGPISKKKLANITKARSEHSDLGLNGGKSSTATVNMVEDASSE